MRDLLIDGLKPGAVAGLRLDLDLSVLETRVRAGRGRISLLRLPVVFVGSSDTLDRLLPRLRDYTPVLARKRAQKKLSQQKGISYSC